MTSEAISSWRTEVIALLYALAFILLIAGTASKHAISWLLMKLYEMFIQKPPVKS